MKFVAISDTHGQHRHLILPEGDVIIHAGDLSQRGTPGEIRDFLDWFAALPYRYRIFIAGNHDFYFEKAGEAELRDMIPAGVIYLCDSGVTLEGVRIWGSPVTPWFFDWAFNRQRGPDIARHWAMIPPQTDILIAHGPVYGQLDRTVKGEHVGCRDLLERVSELRPRIFLSGHIHEAYGQAEAAGTRYLNAAVLDETYRLRHAPLVFEL
jgi:predicted phosphohydrolase